MKEIRGYFAVIEDTRHQSYVKHKLSDVLILVMGAVISGITELSEMMVYFENKLPFYQEHYGIENYPSKPTLSRLLNMLDGDKIGHVLIEVMKQNQEELGNIIAVDGKAIRSTGIKGKPHSFLQILTAYATESGVTLEQSAIMHEEKTNEIPVFQNMLEALDIKGKTITADAMHCQRETCRKIIQKGGDYVLGLKGNQETLREEVTLFFENSVNKEDISVFQTVEQNGGRIEKRVCKASDHVSWLSTLSEWKGLKTVFAVTRTITEKGKTTCETGYYISSLPCCAKTLLYTSRSHWKIESMHWMLDVIWKEDRSGLLSDNGLKTLNSFRKLALLAHKKYIASLDKKKSVKSNVFATLLDDNLLLSVLQNL